MVIDFVNMIERKIEGGEKLCVSSECGSSHIITSMYPETIDTSHNDIYIEGNDLIFHMTSDQQYFVTYDEEENMFIVKQGEATYYFS